MKQMILAICVFSALSSFGHHQRDHKKHRFQVGKHRDCGDIFYFAPGKSKVSSKTLIQINDDHKNELFHMIEKRDPDLDLERVLGYHPYLLNITDLFGRDIVMISLETGNVQEALRIFSREDYFKFRADIFGDTIKDYVLKFVKDRKVINEITEFYDASESDIKFVEVNEQRCFLKPTGINNNFGDEIYRIMTIKNPYI